MAAPPWPPLTPPPPPPHPTPTHTQTHPAPLSPHFCHSKPPAWTEPSWLAYVRVSACAPHLFRQRIAHAPAASPVAGLRCECWCAPAPRQPPISASAAVVGSAHKRTFEPELWSPLARDGDRGAQSRHGAARRSYGRAAKSAACGCACLHVCVRRGAVTREGVRAARGRGEEGFRAMPWRSSGHVALSYPDGALPTRGSMSTL